MAPPPESGSGALFHVHQAFEPLTFNFDYTSFFRRLSVQSSPTSARPIPTQSSHQGVTGKFREAGDRPGGERHHDADDGRHGLYVGGEAGPLDQLGHDLHHKAQKREVVRSS